MRAQGSYTSAPCASRAAPSPHAHMRACRAPHAGDLARVACASSKQAVSTRRFAPRSNSGFEAFMDRPGKPGWIANASASPHGRSAMALSLHNNDSPCGHPEATHVCPGPLPLPEGSALAAPRPRPRRGCCGALCRPKHHRCHRLWQPRRRSDRASPSLSRAASVRARSSLSTSAGKSIHTYVSTQASKVANSEYFARRSEYFARRSIWSIFCLFTYFMICAATMLKWGARTCG